MRVHRQRQQVPVAVLRGCLAIVLLLAMPAYAGLIDIGGGWQASWDASLDTYVSIASHGVFGDAVVIEKSAEFIQGPVFGVFPSIPITFTQTQADAVPFIVIDDEILRNSTGVPWTDFHFDLLDGPDAAFDPVRTGGGPPPIGFSISPFTQAAFDQTYKRLDIWDGVVADGQSWYPGDGATDGQLWIAVNPKAADPYTTFILKETPTPEPGTLALLVLGACAMLRRRR